jgi:hypothetical protein
MQKEIKKLLNSLKSQNSNVVTEISNVETLNTFENELTPKSYYLTYKPIYIFAGVFSYLTQIASVISSYSFFAGVLGANIPNIYLLAFFVCVILLTIELVKRLLTVLVGTNLFGIEKKKAILPIISLLLVSMVSIYASVIGGGSLGIDTKKVVITETKFDTEIATLRTEIKAIQDRNSYKGKTYLPKKERELLHAKERELTNFKAAKDNELQKVNELNTLNETRYKYGFAVIELLFFACMYFIFDFKRKSVLENLLINSLQDTGQSIQGNNSEQTIQGNNNTGAIPQSTPPQRIGFTFANLDKEVIPQTELPNEVLSNTTVNVNGERITVNVGRLKENEKECEHCKTVFTYKHWNAKYCGDDCRIAAWELRTGKTFNKGKIK